MVLGARRIPCREGECQCVYLCVSVCVCVCVCVYVCVCLGGDFGSLRLLSLGEEDVEFADKGHTLAQCSWKINSFSTFLWSVL